MTVENILEKARRLNIRLDPAVERFNLKSREWSVSGIEQSMTEKT
jgi:hypothetical protein